MAPILYKKDISPPSRAVLLTAKALELELEMKDIDMATGEHLEEDYIQKNPQHTIPMLEDEDFALVDSHAIMIYLITKYGNEDNASLYPEDPVERSLVHHRLFFNCGTLQTLIGQIVRSVFFEGETTIPERLIAKVNEAYGILEKLLGDREWMVGESTTIADIAMISTLTSLNIIIPIDEESFPKLSEWLARIQDLPYYEANEAGLAEFKGMHDKIMGGGE